MAIKKTAPAAEKPTLNSRERALRCAELAFDKKAFDIRVVEITRISSIADFLVIISGGSDRQVQAIADSIRIGLKKYGKVNDVEGEAEGKWIVMDYGDVLVHVFHDPMMIATSIPLVAPVAFAIAAVVLRLGLRPYRQALLLPDLTVAASPPPASPDA